MPNLTRVSVADVSDATYVSDVVKVSDVANVSDVAKVSDENPTNSLVARCFKSPWEYRSWGQHKLMRFALKSGAEFAKWTRLNAVHETQKGQ